MLIGFDFDETLDTEIGKRLARKYISEGHTVVIVTQNYRTIKVIVDHIRSVCNELGIDYGSTIFCGHMNKYLFMDDNFDIFYDNDIEEVNLINKHLKCVAVHFNQH